MKYVLMDMDLIKQRKLMGLMKIFYLILFHLNNECVLNVMIQKMIVLVVRDEKLEIN